MRELVMGFAVAGLIAMAPKSEARLPACGLKAQPFLAPQCPFSGQRAVFPRGFPMLLHGMPKGEVGMASWYGGERQGKPTASRELFDKDKLTAAHRNLPLGTTVRVTNLQNLRSTLLRINDRGPGMRGRLIDVSWAAARKLGFLQAGLVPVEVDVVSYPQCYVTATGPRPLNPMIAIGTGLKGEKRRAPSRDVSHGGFAKNPRPTPGG
jgi:rare lipoprotein A